MAITVKYFAVLRERLGKSEDVIEFNEGMKVSDVLEMTVVDKTIPKNLMVAVNMEYTRMDKRLHDDDEVAFFPAVTGG